MAAREYTYTVYAQAPNVIHIFLIMITKNIYPLPKNTQGTHRQYRSFFFKTVILSEISPNKLNRV